MAAKILENFQVQATLETGTGGVFDVKVNGELVFSKGPMGEFPDEDALIKEIQNRYK